MSVGANGQDVKVVTLPLGCDDRGGHRQESDDEDGVSQGGYHLLRMLQEFLVSFCPDNFLVVVSKQGLPQYFHAGSKPIRSGLRALSLRALVLSLVNS